MDDKLKVLWNLDVLVKMCRSKSDGPSLRVEEIELESKISGYQLEISDLKSLSDDDCYDSSAEMADRNIEIITKKQLQTLKNELKEKNQELTDLKEKEAMAYESTNLLRESKASYDRYILSMQERIVSVVDSDTIDRYNNLINDTSSKIKDITEQLKEESRDYDTIQGQILVVTAEIEDLEEKIDKKKKLLEETQVNLENKDNYIDHSKRDKNANRIKELEEKIDSLNKRLEELRADPKYIETKIKDIINNDEDPFSARNYIIDLVNIAIRQPYINVANDNKLEEELLRATQARDSIANEIDQKSYNILEADTPEKVRIGFLELRIAKWQAELASLEEEVALVDQDRVYFYEAKDNEIKDMIAKMKSDLLEFQKAYDETLDSNISLKASLKVSLDEKREDIVEAEKIATAFRLDEAKDIDEASQTIKVKCEELKNNIVVTEKEIAALKNRLLSKKAGLIDISARNKDKEVLKELAQTVIDLKHRRQFPDTPLEVARRLEEELNISFVDSIDLYFIEETRNIVNKNYEELIDNTNVTVSDVEIEKAPAKRGVKVVTEDSFFEKEALVENIEDNSEPLITSLEALSLENEENSVNDSVQIDENAEINNTLEQINDTILVDEVLE